MCYIDLDPQKKEISFASDFASEVLFTEIDKENIGFVDFQNLSEYFKFNNYYPYEEEIISILRRLDKNDDGRLASNELELGLKPIVQKEFKSKDYKSIYSTPMLANDKNLSASKTLSKHIKQSSITYNSSNNKKNSSPYYKSSAIYRSPISSKKNNNIEETDSYSKIASKYEKESNIANKIQNSNINFIPNNEALKSPSKYAYYPYEPVRKAFSPMKEQILKSSLLEPSQNLMKNTGVNPFEKNQATNLIEKYDKYSNYRAKYSNGNTNDYKMRSPPVKSFKRNEETSKKYESNNKNEIINYFKKVVHFENEIEKSKQDLFFRPDFNLFDLYMVFDKEKKGYCFLNDFEQAFKLMNVNILGKETMLFFKKFEKNNCGRLRLPEFSKIFSPILLEGQPQSERRSINNEGQFDYFEVFFYLTFFFDHSLMSNFQKFHQNKLLQHF